MEILSKFSEFLIYVTNVSRKHLPSLPYVARIKCIFLLLIKRFSVAWYTTHLSYMKVLIIDVLSVGG